MTKQCNINSRGKAVRLAGGIVIILLACMVVGLIIFGVVNGVLPWVVAISLLAFGLFALYEGWSGWCVLRAIGVKTWF